MLGGPAHVGNHTDPEEHLRGELDVEDWLRRRRDETPPVPDRLTDLLLRMRLNHQDHDRHLNRTRNRPNPGCRG